VDRSGQKWKKGRERKTEGREGKLNGKEIKRIILKDY
jgi:hypothetical protein